MADQYEIGSFVLGNWKLIKLLGEGSYGKVYEAHREDFGITYKAAIKIISVPSNPSEITSARAEGLDDESITAYFRSVVESVVSEFGLMSKLKGTANVVSYEDHTVIPHQNGIGWDILIRMELLTPMLDYMSQHKMTRQDIIQLGMDMCRALELCQKYNIIHRDIKPENMFISDLGDYKLGDFGVARTLEKTTGGLSKKGTYTYMAPEIYREEPYGSTVDIYSLGIVMYRLLNNNRAPFLPQPPAGITHSDREKALVRRVSGESLPKPANAEGRLAEIVLKACAYDPGARYSSPFQMRQELEAIAYSKAEDGIVNRSQEPISVSKTAFQTATPAEAQKKSSDPHKMEVSQFIFKHTDALAEKEVTERAADPWDSKKQLRKNRFWKGLAIASAAVILCGGLFFALREYRSERSLQQASTTPQITENLVFSETATAPETISTTTETASTHSTAPEIMPWQNNILKKGSYIQDTDPVYGSEIPKNKVVAVSFLDTLANAPSSSWDVSEAGDGSVLAWVSGYNNEYELFIAGEGGVNGVNACSALFADYSNLTQVKFNHAFHTEQSNNMSSMFFGCESLTELDLSDLDTGNVVNMGNMFGNCKKLQEVDLRCLNTANVTSMMGMFSFCTSLTKPDMRTWDTSNVKEMQGMFEHCLKLEQLDLSTFDTSSVTDMSCMFEGCTRLKSVDLSSFNTASVTDLSEMFYECPVLNDMDLSHFDISQVDAYYRFMNANKTVNGKPWPDFFQERNEAAPYLNFPTDEEGFVCIDNSSAPKDRLCVLGYRVSDGREINNPRCTVNGQYTQLDFSWKETSDITSTLIGAWKNSSYSESEMKAQGDLMLSVWKAGKMVASIAPEYTVSGSFSVVPENTCYVLLISLDKDMNIVCYTVLKLGYPE